MADTKSRYEVISDLEKQKRDLIHERDELGDDLKEKERKLKNIERAKSDEIMVWDRQIEDIKEDIDNFNATMKERKETIIELIKSIDDSLARFGKLAKQE